MLAEAVGSSEGWLTRRPVATCSSAVARFCWLCCMAYCISGTILVTRMMTFFAAFAAPLVFYSAAAVPMLTSTVNSD